MRTLLIALALLAAACSPPAQNADSTTATNAEEAAQAPQNPYVAALAGEVQTGAWISRTDEGVTSACFGAPQSECVITVVCEMPSGKISLSVEHELAPDQATTIRLFTATQTFDLPAQSFNEGLPNVTATVADNAPEKTPLIGMLGTPTERFGAEIAGARTVYPWDASVAAVLTACR
ncbi:hypothetical protein [Terricaulis sp.]|uniref:hypothetical protein n=1 Tax=Terricaulis sp. TaxID=2768686 RepID=UPI0037836ED5